MKRAWDWGAGIKYKKAFVACKSQPILETNNIFLASGYCGALKLNLRLESELCAPRFSAFADVFKILYPSSHQKSIFCYK
jgi:hypothetical protein